MSRIGCLTPPGSATASSRPGRKMNASVSLVHWWHPLQEVYGSRSRPQGFLLEYPQHPRQWDPGHTGRAVRPALSGRQACPSMDSGDY
jgi:hypothetical protein